MGTNFFWSPDGGAEGMELHIGKRSGAGGGLCSWCLQGHKDVADAPIDSWKRWKYILRNVPGVVIDEYGAKQEIEDFIAEVESTTPENRRRQYDWVQRHKGEYVHLTLDFDDWLCPDGFSFTYKEFA